MGRWSKEKIKENALELVYALNEHLEDNNLSTLEKLKNEYEICAHSCDSSFTMRFLRGYEIENELKKHNMAPFFGAVNLKFFG